MKCLSLGLVSCLAWQAAAWNHVGETKLQVALDVSGYTLVACKFCVTAELLFAVLTLYFAVVLVCYYVT